MEGSLRGIKMCNKTLCKLCDYPHDLLNLVAHPAGTEITSTFTLAIPLLTIPIDLAAA